MKKLSKLLSVVMTLCLVFSLSVLADAKPDGAPAAASGSFAQVDDTHWAGDSLTIESVEIADAFADYVDATLFCNVAKVVYNGGEIVVDSDNYVAILTVDGVQYDLYNAAGETFTGDVQIELVKKAATASGGNSKFGDDAGSQIGAFAYTAAAYFDGGYVTESSATTAQGGAEVSDAGVNGMVFNSQGDYFSGVYAKSGDVAITDSVFTAFGKGGDDFTGQGCAVVAAGSANVTIDGCVFDTEGALRSAIWAGGSANVDITDTVVQSRNDTELVPYSTEDNYATSMMQQVPFALGLTGNIRATLDCGQATLNFTDSLIASDGWAVLSTDSGSGTMIATDTTAIVGYINPEGEVTDTVTVNGEEYSYYCGGAGEMSGYIAYCDGFTDYAYGGRWFAPDYLVIITGGSVTVGKGTDRFYGWCDRTAFMSHQTSSSTLLDVSEADFDVADNFCVIKSKGSNGETVNLTDVSINLYGENPWSGNLLEVIQSDDLGGGPGATTFTIPYSTYDEYLACENTGAGGVTTLNVTDCDLVGNVYDSVGSMNGTSFKADSITVNLVNSSLEGAVSSAYAPHCTADGSLLLGEITVDSYNREGTYDYLVIGRVINFAAPTVCNPVSLNLSGSEWTCTGLSYLASLTLDDTSVINGDVYDTDGNAIDAKAGTYENVVVVPAGEDFAATVAAAVTAIEDATAAGVVPEDCSALVANTDMGDMGNSDKGDSGMPEGDKKDDGMPAEEEPAAEEPAKDEGIPATEEAAAISDNGAMGGEELDTVYTLASVNIMDAFTLENVQISFEDLGGGVKTFDITFDGNEITGQINAGVWTPDGSDENEVSICSAVQAAYEAENPIGN